MRKVFASLQCAVLLAALVFPTLTAFGGAAAQKNGPEFVPGQLIVQFRPGVSDDDKIRALGRANGIAAEKIAEAFAHGPDKGELVLADFPGMMSLNSARRNVEEDPAVEFAEPNWIYTHQATTNDTYFANGSLWGMYGDASSPANQYGSQAAEAWAAGHTNCSSVYVGIIDEGFMYSHEDLAPNAWTNPFDPADGVDNDGNGYVDDIHGWDFDGGNNSTFDGTTDDHGTHVAGTIGGIGDNGKGVAGVCWSVKLISAKFLGRRGGTTANAIKAVDYFNDLKSHHGLNIVATNNSWGGGGYSKALEDAITRAGNANILFIAAAGNDGSNNDATASYPSGYPNDNIISVASITSTGALSSFSNYGATKVDIGAPGSSIYSTLPKSSKGVIVSGYGSYSGTSMATPHVTGAAALYAAYHANSSAASIKAAILNAAVPTASLSGKTVTGGRLNVSGF